MENHSSKFKEIITKGRNLYIFLNKRKNYFPNEYKKYIKASKSFNTLYEQLNKEKKSI